MITVLAMHGEMPFRYQGVWTANQPAPQTFRYIRLVKTSNHNNTVGEFRVFSTHGTDVRRVTPVAGREPRNSNRTRMRLVRSEMRNGRVYMVVEGIHHDGISAHVMTLSGREICNIPCRKTGGSAVFEAQLNDRLSRRVYLCAIKVSDTDVAWRFVVR